MAYVLSRRAGLKWGIFLWDSPGCSVPLRQKLISRVELTRYLTLGDQEDHMTPTAEVPHYREPLKKLLKRGPVRRHVQTGDTYLSKARACLIAG